MKKIILWGLTFLVILTLSSCSKNKNSKYDSVISDLKSDLLLKGIRSLLLIIMNGAIKSFIM